MDLRLEAQRRLHLQLGMSMYVRIKRQRQTIFLHCESMLLHPQYEIHADGDQSSTHPLTWNRPLQAFCRCPPNAVALVVSTAVLRADVRFFFVLLTLVVFALVLCILSSQASQATQYCLWRRKSRPSLMLRWTQIDTHTYTYTRYTSTTSDPRMCRLALLALAHWSLTTMPLHLPCSLHLWLIDVAFITL